MKQTLLIIASCLLFLSCKKNTPDEQLFQNCKNPQYLDSATITTKLAGSWTLIKICLGCSGKIVATSKPIKVTFNSDSTYSLFEDSSVIAHRNWKLIPMSENMWGLDLTPDSSWYLYGYISFCDDQVLFSYSILDGNDNLFEKAK